MSSANGGGTQLVTMLVTFILVAIPIAIVNATIARRKGKNAAEYGWLSVIPVVGYFVAYYLLSLPDKSLQDKLDRILEILAAAPAAAPAGTPPSAALAGSPPAAPQAGSSPSPGPAGRPPAADARPDPWVNRPPKD